MSIARSTSGLSGTAASICIRKSKNLLALWRLLHLPIPAPVAMSTAAIRKFALKFLRKLVRRYSRPREIVTDRLPSYGAVLKELGGEDLQSSGRWFNRRVENLHLPLRRRERAMLRFRCLRSLQTSAAVQASVLNHFNQERSLCSRADLKMNPAVILKEWPHLCAA